MIATDGTVFVVARDSRAATRVRAALVREGVPAHAIDLDESGFEATLRYALRRQSPEPVYEPAPDEATRQERLDSLRPREREIVLLLLQHNRVPAVAQQLGLSQHTVRNHLKHAFRRTGARSQQALLQWLGAPQSGHPRAHAPVDYLLASRSTNEAERN